MTSFALPAQPGQRLEAASPWSYVCGQCGNCCKDKDFILTPYDVGRLAETVGLSTAETLSRFVDPSRPALKTVEGGWCVFFAQGQGCTVHAGRPAVCRLYPLGRTVTREGRVVFEEAEPHPDAKGRYGVDGTVSGYLDGQGMGPYLDSLMLVGAFLDDAFAAANRAGVLDQLDAAVFAFWTGEGGPVPFNVLGQDMMVSAAPLSSPLQQLADHLDALRPLCGLDLAPDAQSRLLDTVEGRACVGRLVVTAAVLGVGLGLAPGFSRPPEA
jgi:Fe-S-cluster containining protein